LISVASSDLICLGPIWQFVGACLLAPELAGLHAAKLYVIQQAVKETQPPSDNSDSTKQPALFRLEHLYYRSSHFWLLGWLTPMSATRRVHCPKSSWTNTWWSSSHVEEPVASNFGCIARLALDLLSAPASEAYVEHIFPLFATRRRNRLKKNLEMRVFLKLNNNILSWKLIVLLL